MWELNGKLLGEIAIGAAVAITLLVLCCFSMRLCSRNPQPDPAQNSISCLDVCCKSCILACLQHNYPPPPPAPPEQPPINPDPAAPPPSPLYYQSFRCCSHCGRAHPQYYTATPLHDYSNAYSYHRYSCPYCHNPC